MFVTVRFRYRGFVIEGFVIAGFVITGFVTAGFVTAWFCHRLVLSPYGFVTAGFVTALCGFRHRTVLNCSNKLYKTAHEFDCIKLNT